VRGAAAKVVDTSQVPYPHAIIARPLHAGVVKNDVIGLPTKSIDDSGTTWRPTGGAAGKVVDTNQNPNPYALGIEGWQELAKAANKTTELSKPEEYSTVGEYIHYSDPVTGSVPTVAPILRRELRRHRNDLVFGELSRVIRDYETFRTDEFHWRGSPPAAVAFHKGKNPRALKYDGCHAIDHDRVGVEQTLREDADDSYRKYFHKVATELCNQNFENMMALVSDQIHDKATTQYSKLRPEAEKSMARYKMEELKALRKIYHEKLLFDQYEAHKLVYCREPQILKTYTGMAVNPLHTTTYHSDGDKSVFN